MPWLLGRAGDSEKSAPADCWANVLTEAETLPHGKRCYPYGEIRSIHVVTTPYRFACQLQEELIGLYYQTRRNAPALGRFVQADTLVPEPGNPQALNRYAYVYNNPVRYLDLSGSWPEVLLPLPAPYAQPVPTGTPRPTGNKETLGALYVSQGKTGDKVSNNCGPANAAMVVNFAYWQSGRVDSVTLADGLTAVPGSTRLGRVAGTAAGASLPIGVKIGINQMSGAESLGWTASVRGAGTLEDLRAQLDQGNPVAVLLVYDAKTAHYVTVTGYDSSTGTVSYLDPDPKYAGLPPGERVQKMAWSEFDSYWGTKSGGTQLSGAGTSCCTGPRSMLGRRQHPDLRPNQIGPNSGQEVG